MRISDCLSPFGGKVPSALGPGLDVHVELEPVVVDWEELAHVVILAVRLCGEDKQLDVDFSLRTNHKPGLGPSTMTLYTAIVCSLPSAVLNFLIRFRILGEGGKCANEQIDCAIWPDSPEIELCLHHL